MAKLSGVGIAALAGGALLLYSAINGKGFSQSLRAILSGQSPSTAATANPIDPNIDWGVLSNTPANYPASIVEPSSSSETAWISSFLASIGAPLTQANINSVSSWIAKESVYPGNGTNTGGLYNPLNTTLAESGATNYNSVGVKNYVSEAQGLEATVATLLGNEDYSDIVDALRNGTGLCGQSLSGLATWSGNGYSQVC
jgi:hypothetical protein